MYLCILFGLSKSTKKIKPLIQKHQDQKIILQKSGYEASKIANLSMQTCNLIKIQRFALFKLMFCWPLQH